MTNITPRDLSDLLENVAAAARSNDTVSVREVLEQFGERSITPVVLVIAVILISPISGVPGMPTLSACLIILLAVQALGGRRRLWVPDILLRQRMSGARLEKMVGWLRKPSAFVDRHSTSRLTVLTRGPVRLMTLLACICIPLAWPILEILPFVTSIGAFTVALLVFGLFMDDGLYVLAGYGMIALTLGVGLFFLV
ncbi:exopolysaccharide biosynthesis protein [Sulfitobacter sp. F26169L]|uniref:exopolysaccharide biosynthesis protein n=1 Tax=Sulfitobacter sp. F26169L TaxID=2996015 RepID=UPI002260954C|nr:exopolysaccharide biosynthesis protein [Sulfitobacter sp. F26169L]MCX7566017.1 exopolysaccharide biosynthesis protein [Sulfitobacter sp. F26169L]